MHKCKVTIIGAGTPGLTLAILLADLGLSVTIVDKGEFPKPEDIKPSARTTALWQQAVSTLQQTGIWDNIKHKCTPIRHLTIIDDSTFPRGEDRMVKETFSATEIDQDVFGYNIPLGDLTAVLAERVRKDVRITFLENTEVRQKDPVITQADLVVGADGRNSVVRSWADIDTHEKDYGQSAITCVISHTLPHNETSTEFHRSGGPCTFVPHGEKQSAVVWVEKTDDADAFMTLPKEAFVSALQERSRGILGKMELQIGPECWPLKVLRARRLVASKTVLIAEAAHVIPPIGAQGLNLSLGDVKALSDFIKNARMLGQDIGSIACLKQYEAERKKNADLRIDIVDGANRAVATSHGLTRKARRLALKSTGFLLPIRRRFLAEGMR